MRFTLRAKLALVSLLLLLIPLLGLRLNSSLKSSLISSQEDALNLTALAVSAALDNRADLFVEERFHSLDQGRDLYLFQLSNPIQLNGDIDDWPPEFQQAEVFGKEHVIAGKTDHNSLTVQFRHIAGKQGEYLYAVFDVEDDQVVYRDRDTLSVDRSDHLQILIGDTEGFRKFIVPGYEPGWVMGFLTPEDSGQFPSVEKRIHGKWKETGNGYILEIRIHLDLLESKLAFGIADVDDKETGAIEAIVGTARVSEDEGELGWLLTTSTAIETILKSLDRPYARIRVVDRNQRIRAKVGGLHDSPGRRFGPDDFGDRLIKAVNGVFQPFYNLFTRSFSTDIEVSTSQPTEIDIPGIREGLEGASSTVRYRIKDDRIEVMAAVTPVYDEAEVVAVVLVEQTTNPILSLSKQLIEETISLSVIAFLIGGGALFVFALVISTRIRTLRNQADASITESGKIRNAITKTDARDEIGDLGRTLDTMLRQLQEQIDYRERMADNLEHEMRTPLAGVAASLKNIEEELGDRHPGVLGYLEGAKHNSQRLHELLTAIREGVTLKASLSQENMEVIDFGEAISRWLDFAWRDAFPGVEFVYKPSGKAAPVNADADRLLQALDKIIENAVSYHQPGTPVELVLNRQNGFVSLQVINQGSTIDPNLRHQIFEYMVSSRVSKDGRPHLGLGLYIARTIIEYHQGSITADTLQDGRDSVVFIVKLPLLT